MPSTRRSRSTCEGRKESQQPQAGKERSDNTTHIETIPQVTAAPLRKTAGEILLTKKPTII